MIFRNCFQKNFLNKVYISADCNFGLGLVYSHHQDETRILESVTYQTWNLNPRGRWQDHSTLRKKQKQKTKKTKQSESKFYAKENPYTERSYSHSHPEEKVSNGTRFCLTIDSNVSKKRTGHKGHRHKS